MPKPVRYAVFPVAGLGTRLLPATKTMPKEMLTIVDRPLIQYAVDEAREAGIERLVFITGRGKASLVDYFDMAYELEKTMEERGKSKEPLAPSRAGFGELLTVRQQEPLGLGHAIWCARHITGDEPFAVLLPDDLMVGKPGALKQMMAAYEEHGGNIVCAQDVPREKTSSYGIVEPGESANGATEVKGMVEKPVPEDAPSTLGIVGRYILQPEVMDELSAHEKGAGGEIQLTDAMAKLIGKQPFHAVAVDAVRHDCGTKAGFALANLALGMDDPEVAPRLKEWLARNG
ncbi:UTP--glucose-1-phosphate uridylyltransferase [Sphingomicrobium astaxanthinifaciens]|uniref:UTP--glucose-1-phosphate uridylyltransferase n=1 Tax=Sphingomicrobium astaxanthinifaciens TaxID=1227949 RepID=UPI001FCA7450|nr:UTP--glucose-1-phosphate uridylyltransferase [Sphingomicrobium astaxanthinifaciens]MCJ7421312.1 UTP--glucose-1-phosphate uridylyltransferase [Sphingomicrobium astaxanthinifaciens]